MAKLTRAETTRHNQAIQILKQEKLTQEDKEFVFQNWQEGANHVNGSAGAFFTPIDLAFDFALDPGSGKVIDICAGIGMLSYAVMHRNWYDFEKGDLELTCIEINPDYVEIGKKLVPEANWICANALDILDLNLGRFNVAISNPPFGNIQRSKDAPRYKGKDFEYHVIDIASHIADYGVFILPQGSAGFNYSGRNFYERQKTGRAVKFQELTGLHLEAGCGVDTSIYKESWHGVSPICEIVTVEFPNEPTKN